MPRPKSKAAAKRKNKKNGNGAGDDDDAPARAPRHKACQKDVERIAALRSRRSVVETRAPNSDKRAEITRSAAALIPEATAARDLLGAIGAVLAQTGAKYEEELRESGPQFFVLLVQCRRV